MNKKYDSFYGSGNGREVTPDMCFDRHRSAVIYCSGSLPHWEQNGVLQFITFRLADSMPKSRIDEIAEAREEWLTQHPKPWNETTRLEFEKIDDLFHRWLDAGYGRCELKIDACRKIVTDALKYFDGRKYDLYDYVVMPNHIHFILLPYEGERLCDIIHSIKSFTTKKINQILDRKGRLWQRDYFDRLIRSVKDYDETAAYILHNAQTLM